MKDRIDSALTPEDVETFNAFLDRYPVIAIMDAIAAKYQDVPRPQKRLDPFWRIELTIFTGKIEMRMNYGPFAGPMPNEE